MNWAAISVAVGLAIVAFMVSPWAGVAALVLAAYFVWR
jgi:hypothetical protein